jgi:hypothetical protein
MREKKNFPRARSCLAGLVEMTGTSFIKMDWAVFSASKGMNNFQFGNGSKFFLFHVFSPVTLVMISWFFPKIIAEKKKKQRQKREINSGKKKMLYLCSCNIYLLWNLQA